MYTQLIIPLIATQAIASYCLMYTDDAINVPQVSRTANAQIAHDQAKEKFEMWKVYAFPFFVYRDESLNKNIFYRID